MLVSPPQQVRMDLASLRAQMGRGVLQGAALYPRFARMGLHYGPAFQGITALHRGEGQLLVELSLPGAARNSCEDYLLHPSLMDSALQGSIMLIEELAGKGALPFAVEALHILGGCTHEMVAWVRYAGAQRGVAPNVIKVDIDQCDRDGNLCVQMRGFSARPFEADAAFDEAHYQSIIARLLNKEFSVDEAVELG